MTAIVGLFVLALFGAGAVIIFRMMWTAIDRYTG